MPGAAGICAAGNLGTRRERRRDFCSDENGVGAVSLYRGSAYGDWVVGLGSVQEGTQRAGAGVGAGYGASGEVCGHCGEGDWERAAAAGPGCGVFEAAATV